ncbi:hypothetical protein LWI29_031574 [Acer saccharum]|uniref:Uncharacterized protein n=1 Tax=Acer saccharum TaxID=4024 RepID=A0AA39W7F1_ACESA|nr:hypothetical protein LWI29_031574 [Acer saccharum]
MPKFSFILVQLPPTSKLERWPKYRIYTLHRIGFMQKCWFIRFLELNRMIDSLSRVGELRHFANGVFKYFLELPCPGIFDGRFITRVGVRMRCGSVWAKQILDLGN